MAVANITGSKEVSHGLAERAIQAKNAKGYWQTFAQGKLCPIFVQYMDFRTATSFLWALRGAKMMTAAGGVTVQKTAALAQTSHLIHRFAPEPGVLGLPMPFQTYFTGAPLAFAEWISAPITQVPSPLPHILITSSELAKKTQAIQRMNFVNPDNRFQPANWSEYIKSLEEWKNLTHMVWEHNSRDFLAAVANPAFEAGFTKRITKLELKSLNSPSQQALCKFSALEHLKMEFSVHLENPFTQDVLYQMQAAGIARLSHPTLTRLEFLNVGVALSPPLIEPLNFPQLKYLNWQPCYCAFNFGKANFDQLQNLHTLEHLSVGKLMFNPPAADVVAFVKEHPALRVLEFYGAVVGETGTIEEALREEGIDFALEERDPTVKFLFPPKLGEPSAAAPKEGKPLW